MALSAPPFQSSRVKFLSAGMSTALVSLACAQPVIENLGSFQTWLCSRRCIGITADGTRVGANTVSGTTCLFSTPQIYDGAGNWIDIPVCFPGHHASIGVMSDSGACAGTMYCGQKNVVYQPFGPVPVGPIPGSVSAYITDLNMIGNVGVGEYTTNTPNEVRVFRTSQGEGIQDFGKPAGSIRCGSPSVSFDGNTVVFGCLFPPINGYKTKRIYRRTEATGIVRVEFPNELDSVSSVSISGNGEFLFGTMVTLPGRRAFRYEIATGVTQNLGTLPNRTSSYTEIVNYDGTIVTGTSGGVRFVWHSGSGMMDFLSLIPNLDGWTNLSITGISSGADAWCGNGLRNGFMQPFILRGMNARLACDDIDINNDGSLFDPQDIEAFLSAYSEGPCVPATATCQDIDFNNDGSLFDPCDINAFLLVYSEGRCNWCGL